MPWVSHESLVELFRDCPELAVELLRGHPRAIYADFVMASLGEAPACPWRLS